MAGHVNHRDVGHGDVNQKAPITILGQFTEHAVIKH
jgi:hypothetical protein